MPQPQLLDWVLEGLMSRYRTQVPDVNKVISGMIAHGVISDISDIENDHIAFRTMGVPHLGIQSLEKIFLALGYRKEDFYRFEKKKLNAYWYSPPAPQYPRVFISELCVNELSPETQAIIRSYTDGITEDPVDVILRSFAAQNEENFKGLSPFGSQENDGAKTMDERFKGLSPFGSQENDGAKTMDERFKGLLPFGSQENVSKAYAAAIDAFLHQPLWRTPTWSDYQALAKESEYASWVIYNRYYLNHFTITIHNLPDGYNTVALFNDFLESLGITLNDAGGKAKISPDKKLIQSSTVAQLIDAAFDDGQGGEETHTISGSYVEFAQREILDDYAHLPLAEIKRHHRKEGFERDNADGIFESTYSNQTGKKTLNNPCRDDSPSGNTPNEYLIFANLLEANAIMLSFIERKSELKTSILKELYKTEYPLIHQGVFLSAAYISFVWLYEHFVKKNTNSELESRLSKCLSNVDGFSSFCKNCIQNGRNTEDPKEFFRTLRNAISHANVSIDESDSFVFTDNHAELIIPMLKVGELSHKLLREYNNVYNESVGSLKK